MQTFCGLTTDGMLEYLAAIYKLAGKQERVTTSALAEMMCVSPPAASSMLKRLQDSDFVERSSSDGVTLTEQGRLAALQLIRRHRLMEVFLIQVMGFTWDQVEAEAHRLEHAISTAFEDRMDRLCGYPTHCPHGDPIPRKDGTLPEEPLLSLVDLRPGQQGTLRRVGFHEPSILRYLSQLKLTPGRAVKLVDLAPFNGPVTLELLHLTNGDSSGPRTQILGSELAEQLYVNVEVNVEAKVEAPVGANLDLHTRA
ncbi:MAG: metal-dependent transcriptional regulator [Caldilineaceae bacterium]|nr:metal-dependent transcriptional regulator [Caldilineaceae bacterium]